MNAVTTDHFAASYATRHTAEFERARGHSKRSVVLLTGVLALHAIVGYALTHMKVRASSNAIVPIEVEFITEVEKPAEPPKVSPPARVQTNIETPVMPSIDTTISEAPTTTTTFSIAPTASVSPQRSDGDIATTPRLVSDVAYVRAPRPKYPSAARTLRLAGTVVLRILIDERGHPAQISVQRSSGHRVLDEAAQSAAFEALFKPYVEDGVARQVFVLVPIEFGARSG
jgi:protein TonB